MSATGNTPRPPALDPAEVAERVGSSYPEPFRGRVGERRKRALGDALGLRNFGVNLVHLHEPAPRAPRGPRGPWLTSAMPWRRFKVIE